MSLHDDDRQVLQQGLTMIERLQGTSHRLHNLATLFAQQQSSPSSAKSAASPLRSSAAATSFMTSADANNIRSRPSALSQDFAGTGKSATAVSPLPLTDQLQIVSREIDEQTRLWRLYLEEDVKGALVRHAQDSTSLRNAFLGLAAFTNEGGGPQATKGTNNSTPSRRRTATNNDDTEGEEEQQDAKMAHTMMSVLHEISEEDARSQLRPAQPWSPLSSNIKKKEPQQRDDNEGHPYLEQQLTSLYRRRESLALGDSHTKSGSPVAASRTHPPPPPPVDPMEGTLRPATSSGSGQLHPNDRPTSAASARTQVASGPSRPPSGLATHRSLQSAFSGGAVTFGGIANCSTTSVNVAFPYFSTPYPLDAAPTWWHRVIHFLQVGTGTTMVHLEADIPPETVTVFEQESQSEGIEKFVKRCLGALPCVLTFLECPCQVGLYPPTLVVKHRAASAQRTPDLSLLLKRNQSAGKRPPRLDFCTDRPPMGILELLREGAADNRWFPALLRGRYSSIDGLASRNRSTPPPVYTIAGMFSEERSPAISPTTQSLLLGSDTASNAPPTFQSVAAALEERLSNFVPPPRGRALTYFATKESDVEVNAAEEMLDEASDLFEASTRTSARRTQHVLIARKRQQLLEQATLTCWVEVNVSPHIVCPTAYAIASMHPMHGGSAPRNWIFEGSADDGQTWVRLSVHHEDDGFLTGANFAVFEIPEVHDLNPLSPFLSGGGVEGEGGVDGAPSAAPSAGGGDGATVPQGQHRFCGSLFRVRATGPNATGGTALQLAAMELYGRVLTVGPEPAPPTPPVAALAGPLDSTLLSAPGSPTNEKAGKGVGSRPTSGTTRRTTPREASPPSRTAGGTSSSSRPTSALSRPGAKKGSRPSSAARSRTDSPASSVGTLLDDQAATTDPISLFVPPGMPIPTAIVKGGKPLLTLFDGLASIGKRKWTPLPPPPAAGGKKGGKKK